MYVNGEFENPIPSIMLIFAPIPILKLKIEFLNTIKYYIHVYIRKVQVCPRAILVWCVVAQNVFKKIDRVYNSKYKR